MEEGAPKFERRKRGFAQQNAALLVENLGPDGTKVSEAQPGPYENAKHFCGMIWPSGGFVKHARRAEPRGPKGCCSKTKLSKGFPQEFVRFAQQIAAKQGPEARA